MPSRPPDDSELLFIAFFTDDFSIQITDLSGNAISEGQHGGEARCNGNNCGQSTSLTIGLALTYTNEIEYGFKTRQVVDPDERRAVVAGEGTLSSHGQTERFEFTATFQDNRDGSVWVKYEASRPDASFIIPEAPGGFEFGGQ